jgi:hypothetical protein
LWHLLQPIHLLLETLLCLLLPPLHLLHVSCMLLLLKGFFAHGGAYSSRWVIGGSRVVTKGREWEPEGLALAGLQVPHSSRGSCCMAEWLLLMALTSSSG